MKATVDATEATFEQEVLKSAQPVIVDFWAQWCGPCKMLAPGTEEIAGEQAGRAKVVKVNLDENAKLAEHYRSSPFPLWYFVDGQVKQMMAGAQSKKSILAKLETLVSPTKN